MRPAYWIAIMAIVGAILGHLAFMVFGFLDATIGGVIGILIGAVIYTMQTQRSVQRK